MFFMSPDIDELLSDYHNGVDQNFKSYNLNIVIIDNNTYVQAIELYNCNFINNIQSSHSI